MCVCGPHQEAHVTLCFKYINCKATQLLCLLTQVRQGVEGLQEIASFAERTRMQ